MQIDKKDNIAYFKAEDLVEFANRSLKDGAAISGFREEVLLALFLLRWFKDGKRKESNFLIGFKYRTSREKELMDEIEEASISLDRFDKEYADQDTLSDIIVKSQLDEEEPLSIHFQVKAFPRKDCPETITEELIQLLEKKKNVSVSTEVLIIYSHFTRGLDPEKLSAYLATYPYKEVIHVFWTNAGTDQSALNFLKLKPSTGQHYSLKQNEILS